MIKVYADDRAPPPSRFRVLLSLLLILFPRGRCAAKKARSSTGGGWDGVRWRGEGAREDEGGGEGGKKEGEGKAKEDRRRDRFRPMRGVRVRVDGSLSLVRNGSVEHS